MLWATQRWTKVITSFSVEKLALYAMECPNPKPKVAITSIKAISNNSEWLSYGEAAIFGLLQVKHQINGRNFYVKKFPYGNDNNNGSFNKPFATPTHAMAQLKPGDVLLHGGTYPLNKK